MLTAGEMVKDYEVIAPLRSGGMALLFLARRRGVGGFNRLVVLKLVHPDLVEDAAMTSLFLAEARISAHVAHPNVVHVEEVGRFGDSYFIAMEYVHGVSLAELLQRLGESRLRMSPKLAVWIAMQLAEALHAVHEARGEDDVPLQIVHRDVSPQNVLVGHTGHVKLIDFGIAKSQPTDDPTGHGRAVLGKLGYMAPEQLRLDRVDRRTDVYGLGVLLWEMLSARSLFRCQRIDDEHDWATRDCPPPPSEFSPTKHAALDRVVLKAIALDRNDRYDTAFAFRAALLRAVPGTMQVDAPRFAALMQTLLGDELARRQASLPSELSVQFQLEANATTAKALGIEELTAEVVSASVELEEEYEIVTVADSPAALRQDGVLASLARHDRARRAVRAGAAGQVVVNDSLAPTSPSGPGDSSLARGGTPHFDAIALMHAPWPSGQVLNLPSASEPSVIFTSLERGIVTEPTPRCEAEPIDHRRLARARTARFVAIGTVCAALGVLLGASMHASAPTDPAPPSSLVRVLRVRAGATLAEQRDELTARAESFRPQRDSGAESARVRQRERAAAAATQRSRVARRDALAKATANLSKRTNTARASRSAKDASNGKVTRNRPRSR